MNYLMKAYETLQLIEKQIWPGFDIEIKQLLEFTQILQQEQPWSECRDLICVLKINKTAIC